MLTCLNSPANAQGRTCRHSMKEVRPLEKSSTLALAEEGGKTRVTTDWFSCNASAEKLPTFDEIRHSMPAGWKGAFEQLDASLAKG